jgi:flagellar biosynthesis/type III secretory pathway M-ring protein FliF/YscJ
VIIVDQFEALVAQFEKLETDRKIALVVGILFIIATVAGVILWHNPDRGGLSSQGI